MKSPREEIAQKGLLVPARCFDNGRHYSRSLGDANHRLVLTSGRTLSVSLWSLAVRYSLVALLLAAAGLILASGHGPAIAQYVPGGGPSSGGYGGYGWGGGGYDHASTYEEGVQRGFADIVRSQGMANLMNSQAAGNYEDARKKYIENRAQATETYFQMRDYNKKARAAERGSPLSSEQYVRLAKQQAPDRLGVTQLDPLTGQISWPAQLRQPEYAQDRALIEQLFRERANGVDFNYGDIHQACTALQEKLKANLASFTPNDFITAKKFVDSLSYESKLAVR
jgi:hypothetical protein